MAPRNLGGPDESRSPGSRIKGMELPDRFPEEEVVEHFGVVTLLGEPPLGRGCAELNRMFILETPLPPGKRRAVVTPIGDERPCIHG